MLIYARRPAVNKKAVRRAGYARNPGRSSGVVRISHLARRALVDDRKPHRADEAHLAHLFAGVDFDFVMPRGPAFVRRE